MRRLDQPGAYPRLRGTLWLAWVDCTIATCIALYAHMDSAAEMERLYYGYL